MITLSAILMFAIMGLVVDIGWAHFRKNAAQAAADAAALAAVTAASASSPCSPVCGASKVLCQAATACPTGISDPPANNVQAGCLYAKSNGFVASGKQNVVMTANTTSPPPNAPGAKVLYWANASVTETQLQLFSAILGNKSMLVGANATAAMLPGNGGGCIYVMDPSGSSITVSGAPVVQSGCGIYVNSTGSPAVLYSGSPTFKTTGGAVTNMVASAANACLPSGCAAFSPAPKYSQTAVADPFASMQPPAVGSCTFSGPVVVTTNQTLNPGVYCGGIITSGTETITLNPGLYVIKSGITESGSPTFNGNGVTLYFNTGGITGSGTGSFNLTGPSSTPTLPGGGTWTGGLPDIAIYEDRTDSSAMALSGSTGNQINGVVYAPKATLTYSGYSGVSGVVTTLVAYDLVFSGTSYISTAANPAGGGSGCPVVLVQ